MTLPQIIEMVEKASEPDRALDFEIANALGIFCDRAQPYLARDYTHSIDSALTLLPNGKDIRWSVAKPTTGTPWGRVWLCETGETIGEAYCATYALALCLAALRARLQSQKESDGE